jgi:DNA-binding NtrC family response regulator
MTRKTNRILFIEDDASGREMGAFNLEKAEYRVDVAATGDQGLEIFDPQLHDLVITDVRMPGISGMEVLAKVKKRSPETPVLVITAYGNVELAVEAMKAGAYDFIGKPFNREHLLLTVARALSNRNLAQEVKQLRIKAARVERPIVRSSEQMEQIIAMADRVARSGATVLVSGESGTGKELIARRIHAMSDRAHGPFVAINAAAIPSELLESELFGHSIGAFTGAQKDRAGRFRQAAGGTLFLDEISNLPAALQGKLLRVIQEKTVDVLGTDEPVPVDVRIVAATNSDLKTEVAKGRFREDLYYRINVVEVEVPPLRDRPTDVEPLARHFVALHGQTDSLRIPEDLLKTLEDYNWPGNVRELENVCQRLVLLASGKSLSANDLPSQMRDDGRSSSLTGDILPRLPDDGLSLLDLEKSVIERVLELKNGNVSQAAVYLMIPRHVLSYRMQKYGISKKG